MQVAVKHFLILVFVGLALGGCTTPQPQISTSIPPTSTYRTPGATGPTSTVQVGQQITARGRLFNIAVDTKQTAAPTYYLDAGNNQVFRLTIKSPVASDMLGKQVTVTGRVSAIGDPSLPQNTLLVVVEVSTIQLAQ